MVLVLAQSWASAPAAAETRVALVIGNSDYADFGRLKNPVNDMMLMAETLRGVGFDVVAEADADQTSMKRAIQEFGQRLEQAGQDAVGLFYFAGHGIQISGTNYMIPVGADITREPDVEIEAVNLDWVLGQMEHARNRLNILIIDACRNNPMSRSFRSSEQGLSRIDAPRGTLIAYATAPGSVSFDGHGLNSPYTEALAATMQEPGLELETAFRKVRVKVMQDTEERQVPWESSSLTGAFRFTPGTEVEVAGTPAAEVATALAPDSPTTAPPGPSLDRASPSAVAARTPLPMPGKEALFQKVLTRPGVDLQAAPGAGAAVAEATLPAFSLFYVYGEQEAGGDRWLEVGRKRDGSGLGWLPASAAIEWKQTIVASFSNPADRDRTLLFDSRDGLIELLESEAVVPRSQELRAQAIADGLPPDSGVVSIEPDTYIDIADQFYLLPILEFEEVFLASGFRSKILKVASVPLDIDPMRRPAPSREELLKAFDAGIVFVIDTTTSMGPYIDATRNAIQRIYDAVAASEIGERVHFGLIGFRDNVALVSGLEYLTRTFVGLSLEQDPDEVVEDLAAVEEAAVSSKGFNEDAMAGVNAALEEVDWAQFDGRYVILITDAGPRAADDPNAAFPLAPAEFGAAAADRGVAIYTLHLKTPVGAFDHQAAEQAYRALSRYDGNELYYDVVDGSVAAFDRTVSQLSEALVGQLQNTANGVLNEAAQETGDPLVDQARLVGLAMQLAYLGRAEGTQAPSVFEAWLAELDFENPRRKVPEVRLVLSKNELATMRDVLKTLVDKFEGNLTARMDAGALFNQLRQAMALMAREPDRVVDAEFETLGGAVGEYLEDLPYQSEIMALDEHNWAALGGGRQREIIDAIKSKLAYYERVHNDPALWTALYEGAAPGEQVFAIPLDRLP